MKFFCFFLPDRLRRPKLRVLVILSVALFTTSILNGQCKPPIPSPQGLNGDNGEELTEEHHFMHSSTHLQGFPTGEKIAPAIHLPGQSSSLAEMRTVLIVNNPSATQTLDVEIEYYDNLGNLIVVNNANIAPEGHHQEDAVPLTGLPWGTIRVIKATPNDPDFVGATMFHTYSIGTPVFGGPNGEPGEYELNRETHDTRIGAASMQQLQAKQDFASELFWGPLPLSTNAAPPSGPNIAWDFFNGNSPLMMLTNPNPTPVNATIFIVDSNFAVISSTITLQPFQSFVDINFFNAVLGVYNSGAAFDLDAIYWVVADSSLVGQGVMFDFFSGNAGERQEFMGRFRMSSMMMPNQRATTLTSPELVSEDPSDNRIATNTLLGVANVGFQDIGPLLVEYRNRGGVVVGSQIIPSFPVLSTLRLGPDSPGYPSNEFAGSVTVTSCRPGLIGWNAKTTEHEGAPGFMPVSEIGGNGFEMRKAWGEVLDGGNGAEPGLGFDATFLLPQRKVGPLNRRSDSTTGFAPGYNHVFNNRVANTDIHYWSFFDATGTDLSLSLGPIIFPGLQAGSTSFTYIDDFPSNVVELAPSGMSDFISSRFEHVERGVSGINALGGYLYSWDSWFVPPPRGSYAGPGDVVPNFR